MSIYNKSLDGTVEDEPRVYLRLEATEMPFNDDFQENRLADKRANKGFTGGWRGTAGWYSESKGIFKRATESTART